MNKKYPDEFKQEAVRQVVEKGYSVPDVSKRLGISDKSLYYWMSKAKVPPVNPQSKNKYTHVRRRLNA